MADIADKAADVEEILRRAALSKRYREGPPAIGMCLNCHAFVDDDKRWCDSDCRDDYLKRDAG